jgi:hypothetical protein
MRCKRKTWEVKVSLEFVGTVLGIGASIATIITFIARYRGATKNIVILFSGVVLCIWGLSAFYVAVGGPGLPPEAAPIGAWHRSWLTGISIVAISGAINIFRTREL